MEAGRRFDVVFMDVQMPELDGLRTTEAIREREKATGGHLLVIAMTAFALKGDRERCLEAGMDGYVSKPIRLTELHKALHAVVPAQAGPPAPTADEVASPASLDMTAALDGVMGDLWLLAELAGLFLAESAFHLEKMGRAGDLSAATEALTALAQEVEHLRPALTDLTEQAPTAPAPSTATVPQ